MLAGRGNGLRPAMLEGFTRRTRVWRGRDTSFLHNWRVTALKEVFEACPQLCVRNPGRETPDLKPWRRRRGRFSMPKLGNCQGEGHLDDVPIIAGMASCVILRSQKHSCGKRYRVAVTEAAGPASMSISELWTSFTIRYPQYPSAAHSA